MSESFVLAGGYGEKLGLIRLTEFEENESSRIELLRFFESLPKPSFLCHHEGKVYVVHELSDHDGENGCLSVWDYSAGALTPLQSVASIGQWPCHIIAHHNFLYVPSYLNSMFGAYSLDANRLIAKANLVEKFEFSSSVVADRQERSHPHYCAIKDSFLYVVDLGADRVWHFAFDCKEQQLVAATPAYTNLPLGSGPRHLAFHPEHNHVYVVTELTCEVLLLEFVPDSGELKFECAYPVVDKLSRSKENYCAHIEFHPSGRFLFVSNRGDGCIVVFKVLDNHGHLELIQRYPTIGSWPRHFATSPNGKYLLCADQILEVVELLMIDGESGMVTQLQVLKCENKPGCLIFLDSI